MDTNELFSMSDKEVERIEMKNVAEANLVSAFRRILALHSIWNIKSETKLQTSQINLEKENIQFLDINFNTHVPF